MKVQLDRLEDEGWAVLILGRRTFDVPRELLPPEARPGDVFEVGFRRDDAETRRLGEENRRMLDELLDRRDQES